MKSLASPTLGLMFTAFALVPIAVAAQQLSIDTIFSEDRPGSWPKQISWRPDGEALAFLLPEEGGQALWSFEVASKESRRLLGSKDLPKHGEEASTFDGLLFSPTSKELLIESGGNLHLLSLGDGKFRTLPAAEPAAESPRFSPDGTHLAFVRGFDLYVRELSTGKEKALTKGGKENHLLHAKTDWVYWEEIWNRDAQAFWWSPSGTHLAYYQFDETPVDSYPLVDFLPTYPTVTWQKYPKAGRPNPRVRLGVVDLKKAKTVWLQTGEPMDDYLARVHWAPKGDRLVVERLNRDQTRLDLLSCDAKSGACKPFFTEEHHTWVNVTNDARFLRDGRFLWTSERSGWRQIYLYGPDGKLERELTTGITAVTSIDGVDEEAGKVIYTTFTGSGIGAAHRMIYRVPLAGGTPEALSPAAGWHEALVAENGKRWLHTVSTAEKPPERRVLDVGGALYGSLPSGPESKIDFEALPHWEFVTIWGLDGNKLPARLLKPANFDPKKKYPVLMYHYGGPGSQTVVNRFQGRDLWHKMMAERGFAVFNVDNITTAFFGKGGEDKVHRDFGDFNLNAQLAGVEYLKSLPWVDGERIGLWGWSGGGTNTLMAVLKKPGVWKAAVAGAPVTDWKLYDSIWTERYLDTPEANPKGYEASSPTTHAAALADHLLLVHGTADDNVHPQNSFVMSQAIIEAGALFEELILPRQKHGLSGKGENHFYSRMTQFFERWLSAP